jgi:Asp-tRNA(Asn)/Glu-tRNA(Gln) amidotransferase A subunit family amidase
MENTMASQSTYDLKSVKLPRLKGGMLKLLVNLMENPLTSGAIVPGLLRDTGIPGIRDVVVEEAPTFAPFAPMPERSLGASPDFARIAQIPSAQKGFAFATIRDYAEAYRSGTVTPEQIAEKVLQAMADSDARTPPLHAFIAFNRDDVMAQARASAQRIKEHKSLSIIDGVPIAVKDESNMLPFGTTVGTKFLGKTPAMDDSTIAARLRAAGALLIGKTNMHEIGIGVTGLNPHHGTVRNPYNTAHHSGGSSSGSGAAVAAGLCPVAIGADGGGSIRIPSAFCGLVGLKTTYARISSFGSAPLCGSVDHYGPLAATAIDAAIVYAIIAGPDAQDPGTLNQPTVTLDGIESVDLKGLKLGIYRRWFEHASPAIVETCQLILNELQRLGAQVIEIEIPNLEAARVAHLVTIATEMMTAMEPYYREHRTDFGLDVRTNFALIRALNARDYVHAQQIRTRTITNFNRVLGQVDAIVTPMTAITAPPIPETTLPEGESDLTTLSEILRYAPYANLTGHPAIAFPVGYDAQGLPVGMQAIGKYWHEHTLLRLARAAEQIVERRAPQVHYKILG